MAKLSYRNEVSYARKLMGSGEVILAVLVCAGCSPGREERIVEHHGGIIIESRIEDYYFTAAFPHATDATLVALGDMHPLVGLDLSGSAVSDDGLAYLAHFEPLETLLLRHTMTTDRGVQHFSSLWPLTTLDLSCTQVTNIGLATVPSSVFYLYLHETMVTDEGVAILARRLPRLISLDLSDTRVTDAGIYALATAKMTWFDSIALDNTEVTDASIEMLCDSFTMRTLSLRNTQITDSAIDRLVSEATIRELDLSGTLVTEVAKARIRNERPDIMQFRRPTHRELMRGH